MREFELLTIATIHEHVAPLVDAVLAPHGFVSTKPLHWLRSVDAPVRQMFAYVQLKGGAVAPQWGFSLDFVPHLSGKKIAWHRTEKSALFDAFVDGQGPKLNLSYMWGVSGLLENMQSRVSAALESAIAFWARGSSLEQVCSLVEELRVQPGSQFYTQLPIASAMCFAICGREAEGRKELERYIEGRGLIEKAVADLWRAFDDVPPESRSVRPNLSLNTDAFRRWLV
jgi:hypothetical protein